MSYNWKLEICKGGREVVRKQEQILAINSNIISIYISIADGQKIRPQ